MCISIVCKPVFDAMNFEVNLVSLFKPFLLPDQKVVTLKCVIKFISVQDN